VSRFTPSRLTLVFPPMPPRVRTPTNALKRKAAEDAKPQEPAKRTRSSGVPPSHFIPLDGAPQPSKCINSLPMPAPHLVSRNKRKLVRPLQMARPRPGTTPHDSGPDQAHRDGSAESSSQDEMSLQSAYNHSVHVTSPQKNGKLVAEVEISVRKLNPSMCHLTKLAREVRSVHPNKIYQLRTSAPGLIASPHPSFHPQSPRTNSFSSRLPASLLMYAQSRFHAVLCVMSERMELLFRDAFGPLTIPVPSSEPVSSHDRPPASTTATPRHLIKQEGHALIPMIRGMATRMKDLPFLVRHHDYALLDAQKNPTAT
jgi:hypothetical protein